MTTKIKTKSGRLRWALGLLMAVVALAAIGFGVIGKGARAEGQSGTTLTATKTATGYVDTVWTVSKSVTPGTAILGNGQSQSFNYTISYTKTTTVGVSGEVCVTNGGGVATEGLAILDEVEYNLGDGNGYQSLSTTPLNLSSNPVLDPAEQGCYSYNITFTPVAGATYRNTAHVSITNHSGWLPGGHNCPGVDPCPFGPDPKADFSLPADADATATFSDVMTCPVGVTCGAPAPDPGFPKTVSASGSTSYTVVITNSGLQCGSVTVPNTVTLTELGGAVHTASASVTIDSGSTCPPTGGGGGCTLTIGYWKTHAGFGPQTDQVSALLGSGLWLGTLGVVPKSVKVTTPAQAVSLLNFNGSNNVFDASNGINKLYAQLLGAKLSIAFGADGSAVAAAIATADAYLATHNSGDWAALTKAQKSAVNTLASTFDSFNNGLIGPGHCS